MDAISLVQGHDVALWDNSTVDTSLLRERWFTASFGHQLGQMTADAQQALFIHFEKKYGLAARMEAERMMKVIKRGEQPIESQRLIQLMTEAPVFFDVEQQRALVMRMVQNHFEFCRFKRTLTFELSDQAYLDTIDKEVRDIIYHLASFVSLRHPSPVLLQQVRFVCGGDAKLAEEILHEYGDQLSHELVVKSEKTFEFLERLKKGKLIARTLYRFSLPACEINLEVRSSYEYVAWAVLFVIALLSFYIWI